MRELESPEPLSSVYRDALERMQSARDDAIHRTEVAMKSTSGWLAAAKAAAAQSVFEATRAECSAQVARLLEAHVDAGEKDAAKVADQVRAQFLSKLEVPGLHFAEPAGPEASAIAAVAARHAAEFESFRDGVAAELAERLSTAVEARRSRVPVVVAAPAASPKRRRFEMSPLLVAFLVVTLLMSLVGVSWMDVVKRVGEMF